MNYLSAFRLLVHFSLLLFLLISCKPKNQTRHVQKSKLHSKKSGIEKKPKEVVTPAIQSDPAGTPKPSNEDGQAPGNAAMKSNRNKNKEKTTRADPIQRDSNIQPPPSSATFQLCTTQEEEVQSKKKPVLKEEYFEDQNDDDTLVCVKSIEN
ncbi:hypothetical protein GCK72_016140 [Caenorhabditis remanei]|uniref:Uncharacterized protein n=1 Tax=Caenorhabditis remanei TaxID=31234 RepID=E3NLX9_CAERE|nr:hypothetical protein GCK72_016140 [Caenorhabditis remanei]EFP06308.1 hypothetical protein CRE_14372 [Caenorhabditis remanei]KAF1759673.1 hypothetical protein GCK72_016140 [Caenorhabditis remanei]